MKIKVNTYFDITETGINRVYKGQQLPVNVHGNVIDNAEKWNLMRKQQSNLETILQVLQMRSTLSNISKVKLDNNAWTFTFDVSDPLVYGSDLQLLKQEMFGVPMTVGLTEKEKLDPFLNNNNIWFDVDV